MKLQQKGFGGLQLILSIGIMVAIAAVAVPAYSSFIAKAKMTEAMNLASESKRKMSEFFMLNSRFPQNEQEARVARTMTLSPPEYVREMVIETGSDNHDVLIKVFLKDGVIDNPASQEQYVYIAGDHTEGSTTAVKWSCGGNGIDTELLPEDCRS